MILKYNVLRLSINNGGSLESIFTGCQYNTLKFNKYGPKSYRIGLDFLDSRSPNICIIIKIKPENMALLFSELICFSGFAGRLILLPIIEKVRDVFPSRDIVLPCIFLFYFFIYREKKRVWKDLIQI